MHEICILDTTTCMCHLVEVDSVNMSIQQYLKPINGTLDLNGQLSPIVSSAAIQRMNQEVRVASESSNSLPTNMKLVMEDVQLSSYAYSIAIFDIV